MNSCFITVYENNSKGHMFYVHDSSKESEASLALQALHQPLKAVSVATSIILWHFFYDKYMLKNSR